MHVGKTGPAAEGMQGCGVTEVESIFRSSEIRRFPRRQTGHEHRAAGSQNPAHFRQRASRVSPEMNDADREGEIKGAVGKRHPLGRTEMKGSPTRGDKSGIEGGSFR